MKQGFSTEAEMAAVVVAWLGESGWTVYQEVKHRGCVADIVAIQGRRSWVVECKLAASLSVLDQAMEWVGRAHFVSIAVPSRSGRGLALGHVLESKGIGCIRVTFLNEWERKDEWSAARGVRHDVKPRLYRRCGVDWTNVVCEAQRTECPAGTAGGGYWTPFRETCRLVESAVRSEPGLTMKDLISRVRHHYGSDSTARTCIANWIRAGRISGVQIQEGRPMRVCLCDQTSSHEERTDHA